MAKEQLTDVQTTELIDLGMTFGEIFDLVDRGFGFDAIYKMGQAQQRKRADTEKDARAHTAESNASAMKRALMPENPTHPKISAYSYPEGDTARPRPVLPYEFWWLNTPFGDDVNTAEELELAAQVQPGEFICGKSDGSKMKVTVTADRDHVTDRFTKMTVMFPTRGHQRHNHAPATAIMRELIAQAAAKRERVAVGA